MATILLILIYSFDNWNSIYVSEEKLKKLHWYNTTNCKDGNINNNAHAHDDHGHEHAWWYEYGYEHDAGM